MLSKYYQDRIDSSPNAYSQIDHAIKHKICLLDDLRECNFEIGIMACQEDSRAPRGATARVQRDPV